MANASIMSESSRKIGRSQWLIVAMAAAVVQLLGGWETTLAQTDKEREAEQTLHDLTISSDSRLVHFLCNQLK